MRQLWIISVCALTLPLASSLDGSAEEPTPPAKFWNVEDLRPGMKGHGLSVFKGSKIEKFDAEVIGVLKNTSPGRDLVLVQLTGCSLERTGVIAGMSGSPVYLEGKLLGAVAYAWPFGKDPIAGVTPFVQMAEFVQTMERRDVTKRNSNRTVPLTKPISSGGRAFDQVTIASSWQPITPQSDFTLMPLQTPLTAGGFTQHTLNLFREQIADTGIVPVQAGSAAGHVLKEEHDRKLEPGAPLAVALITGDFDMSGIGTVTHIEADRVYGWGHPFMSLGHCELPLMSGYIHTIYPRQSVSFKMGSPIRNLGVVHADVSTCVAGRLGKKPDMLPLQMAVRAETPGVAKTYQCAIARHKSLLPNLVFSALTNSVDTEGELPEELTAEIEVRFHFEDRPELVIHDVYSGPSVSGGRAPSAMFSHVAAVTQILSGNQIQPVRIQRIDCDTRLQTGRISAEIESAQLESETYAPGETIRGLVFMKPHKAPRERVPFRLKLPPDMPEGTFSIVITDDLSSARQDIRESPVLSNPTKVDHIFQILEKQAATKRSNLVLRVGLGEHGVAVEGQELPNLPGSVVEMLGNGKRTGVQLTAAALVAKQPTDWVVQGSQAVKFTVIKNKRLSSQ